jgi:hypothetical protein
LVNYLCSSDIVHFGFFQKCETSNCLARIFERRSSVKLETRAGKFILLLAVASWQLAPTRAGGAAECSSPCHGEGRGFKSRPARHARTNYNQTKNAQPSGAFLVWFRIVLALPHKIVKALSRGPQLLRCGLCGTFSMVGLTAMI